MTNANIFFYEKLVHKLKQKNKIISQKAKLETQPTLYGYTLGLVLLKKM